MAIDLKKQFLLLKQKFYDLVKKHKQMVVSLQNSYQEKSKEILIVNQRYKKVIKMLKQKLELEQERNARLMVENRAEVAFLQSELQRERAKEFASNMAGNSSGKGGPTNFLDQLAGLSEKERNELGELKDATYAKAQIDSLREELTKEIAKSGKIVASADAKIVVLEDSLAREKEKCHNIEKSYMDKMAVLEENCKKELVNIQKIKDELQSQNSEQQEEIAKLKDELTNREKSIQELLTELSNRKLKISELQAEIEQKIQIERQVIAKKDKEIDVLEKKIKGLTNRAEKLFVITRNYDIYRLHDEIAALKKQVERELKTPTAEKIQSLSLLVSNQEKSVRVFEKKITEKLANFDIDLAEMTEKVKNHFCEEEQVMGSIDSKQVANL